jgi:hypothetical protein
MSCRAGQALRGVVTGVAMLNREESPGFIRESVNCIAAVFAAATPNDAEAAESHEAQSRFISVFKWVGLTGFEPATHGLGNRCSIP